MKKIKLLIVTLLSIILLPNVVNAASGKITVSSTSTTVVGNRVTVTVKLSAGASWEMILNYDKNYLQLVSGGGESKGTKMVNTSTGKPNRTYTFTFKTLKKGSTTVKVGSYYVVDDNFNTMSITSNSKTIKIITQAELEASYSKDNSLKSLSVEGYELIPAFSKNELNYTVNVPEGTTSVKVNAQANDSKASVSGEGEIEVSEGINNVKLVVRAENGSEKTYNLTVNVIDQNPIIVDVDNTKYTVIKLRNNYVCPELFTDSEITIDNFKIPACVNDKIGYTLVGLKKDDGVIEQFIYENGKYTKYQEIVGTSLKIIALDYNDKIEGLKESTTKINDKNHQIFKFSDNSRFYVLYGMNVETGEKNFYVYDSKNNTFSLYDTEHIDALKELNKTYLYIAVAFGAGLFLSLICILSLNKSKNKLKKKLKLEHLKNEPKKKNKKEKEEKVTKDENSEKDDTLVYNLFEDNKKVKNKRTKSKK